MYTCVFSRRIQFQNCTDSELSWNSSTFFQKCLLWGNNVWMEVVQKLVAVALVSMVTSADGLQNCFGLNLGMAAACAMVQAYARPQVRLYPIQVVCCKRIHEWVLFQFFPFVPSLAATSPLSGFSKFLAFAPSPFSWPVCWCLCLPSFSQFTVAPCHVLITSGCLYLLSFSQFYCCPLSKSCKCLVFDAGKVVNVTVITNAEDHQVNLLQSFCFLCLALATLSFHYGWVWSSRAAFALPFVVTAVQGLRPRQSRDSGLAPLAGHWWHWWVWLENLGEWLNSSSP